MNCLAKLNNKKDRHEGVEKAEGVRRYYPVKTVPTGMTSATANARTIFFDQCPHRMACAKCSFYMPKASKASALLEGKKNLLRMPQEIPLTDAEVAALDDGVSALDSLLNHLANVPTPAGPTPLEIRGESERAAD